MHAADVVEELSAARPDDDVLSAVRTVCENGLPGLVVVDDQGDVVGCIPSIDLLRLAMPRYLQDDPGLARVFDEDYADHIAARLIGTRVRDLLGEAMNRVPVARPRATVVEVAELMVVWSCPLVVVEKEGGGTLGVVTANRLLDLFVTGAGEASR